MLAYMLVIEAPIGYLVGLRWRMLSLIICTLL